MSSKPIAPLHGRTIIMTRAQEQQSEARSRLHALGSNVLDLPALVIGPPDDWQPLDDASVSYTHLTLPTICSV